MTVVIILLVGVAGTAWALDSPIRMVVNGQEIEPDVPARLIDGRVMVPVSWITTALHADIYWKPETNTVEIKRTSALASVPEANASLYPFKEEDGYYDGFILEAGTQRKYFAWKNNNMLSWPPQLFPLT
jgi:hypothetical protein